MQWIKCSKRMPANRSRVIACFQNAYGNLLQVAATYIAHHAVKAKDFLDEDAELCDWADWDEEGDFYWTPPGFYESNYHTDCNWFIDDPVLYWMPLPVCPKESTDASD